MSVFEILERGQLNDAIKRYADIGLALLVITVVALLIVPIPTFILDLLICFNISIALIMMLIALYITEVLRLSAFPTILLVTTLFRLGLNVATSRKILLDADGGEVIRAFGEFVVSGNFVVGTVVFLLLMLINMLVVAKGSERVAEVAARFTLDAMPGKQMSIDADLRSGVLDMDEARKKRADLSRESQLFGAMDGAMKFVKGDVIAGIIIFVLNIVAGIIIGVTQKDMSIDEAIETFTILSIGDGLVSIIPALLMSVCAGLIVTRVSSADENSNLGKDVASQLVAQPKAFAIAAIFIGLMGQIPGLPRIPFTIIGLLIGALAYALFRSNANDQASEGQVSKLLQARESKLGKEREAAAQSSRAQEGESSNMMPMVTPITLEVSDELVPLVDDHSNFLSELIPIMRDSLFYELGVRMPGIRVRGCGPTLGQHAYRILLNETPVATGTVEPDKILVNDTVENLRLLGIEARPAYNPINGIPCSFIHYSRKDTAEQAGLIAWDASNYLLLHLSAILRKHAAEFLGIQEVQNMLDQLEQAFPSLVKEVIPKSVSLFQLTEVLRRLVEEDISVRDLRCILQSLSEWGQIEKDPIALAEKVRSSHKRYISHKYTGGHHTLAVYLLDPRIEDVVRSSIQHTSLGSYLALEPEITEEILTAMRKELGSLPATAQRPVIITTQDIRRYFKKMTETEFTYLAVLSYQELSSEINIQPIARISL